jgi:hypothetical protein
MFDFKIKSTRYCSVKTTEVGLYNYLVRLSLYTKNVAKPVRKKKPLGFPSRAPADLYV